MVGLSLEVWVPFPLSHFHLQSPRKSDPTFLGGQFQPLAGDRYHAVLLSGRWEILSAKSDGWTGRAGRKMSWTGSLGVSGVNEVAGDYLQV